MKSTLFSILFSIPLFIPVLSWAALCDDTYYLNSVSQTILAGKDPNKLEKISSKEVNPDLSNLDILDNALPYKVMSQFTGACSKMNMPIIFKRKATPQALFSDTTDSNFQIQMLDSSVSPGGLKYQYWFGFYKPETDLVGVLGLDGTQPGTFQNWYVAIAFVDSVYNSLSGLWQVSQGYYPLSGPNDSLLLEKMVLDATIRKTAISETHKGYFKVQFLKVAYGKTKPLTKIMGSFSDSKFSSKQIDDMVLIQTGASKNSFTEPLTLYGMMGNKVSTLHPTGYVYQWNGKTSTGAQAQTGVYFVQSGNRTLGKFFYSR